MSMLEWDKVGEHLFEAGVDHGVLYKGEGTGYATGVAWNGLTAVNEAPSGAESNAQYADNIKYLDLTSAEEFGGSISAYTYPDEFAECNGEKEVTKGVTIAQQDRKAFGLSYRTKIGNDTVGQDYGYKLHMVYGGKVTPTDKNYGTINDSPEAVEMSWDFTTTPVNVPGYKPTAHIVVNSLNADPAKLKQLEDMLYGTAESEPKLPMPEEVLVLFGVENAMLSALKASRTSSKTVTV